MSIGIQLICNDIQFDIYIANQRKYWKVWLWIESKMKYPRFWPNRSYVYHWKAHDQSIPMLCVNFIEWNQWISKKRYERACYDPRHQQGVLVGTFILTCPLGYIWYEMIFNLISILEIKENIDKDDWIESKLNPTRVLYTIGQLLIGAYQRVCDT